MPVYSAAPTAWPVAGSAVVDLPLVEGARSASALVRVGGLPVRVSPVVSDAVSGLGLAAQPAPASVRVEVLDRAAARRAGALVALRLSRADGGSGPAMVHLQLGYASFAAAFGGGFADRLSVRLLPECGLAAVSTPAALRGECIGVELATANDLAARAVFADVDLMASLKTSPVTGLSGRAALLAGAAGGEAIAKGPGGPVVVALTSSNDATGLGNFGRTDLQESAAWSAGGNSGDFTYSYPMAVPPVPGGLAPQLSLSYSAQSVDGQTAAAGVQPGPAGQGWTLNAGGFIESTFRPCSEDQDHTPHWSNTTDTCVRLENYQLSWAGHSGELVPTTTPNLWAMADDDRLKVELHSVSDTGPYWKLTTEDGTQWFFGRQRLPGWTSGARETHSVLSKQVWSNHDGEPCLNAGSFAASHCLTPYRWYLDYVVDANANSASYWYDSYTNLHGTGGSGNNPMTYWRDGVLSRIEYGTRGGNETTATASAVVELTNSDRCISSCWTGSTPNTANWPDTPWDLNCTAAPCGSSMPSFWSTKRLTAVTTKVWTGTGTTYKTVDQWSLAQSFPGGVFLPVLWLDSITHTGTDATGNTLSVPAVTFHGRIDRNRADYNPNAGMADHKKYRIDAIDTETGGRIAVTYLPTTADPLCQFGSAFPDPDNNASRCFPQWITNPSGMSGWSWWHKFLVDKVTVQDLVGGSPDMVTSYGYSLAGASSTTGPVVLWAYTSSVWTTKNKSWSSWRGYSTVTTTVGAPGTQTVTNRLYFRGLDRDRVTALGDFGRRASITDSLGTTVTDHRALMGQVREEIRFDAGNPIEKSISEPTVTDTAGGSLPSWQTPPERKAYLVRTTAASALTKIADGSWRTTRTEATFNTTYATADTVNDLGDIAIATDDTCTRYTYNRNVQNLTLHAGTGAGMVPTDGSVMSTDWSAYDQVLSPGDFTGDGKPDVIARNRLNTNLYLYTGNGSGGFSAGPTQIGTLWGNGPILFSPGDFSGDGKPDVIYRNETSQNLYMVRGNGTGGWIDGASIQIGTAWTGDRIFSPGDVTGDNKPDVLYRRTSDGKLFYVAGNGTGGWINGASVQIGTDSWSDRDLIFGRGDATGDGKTDLYARVTATGELKLYSGNANGTFNTAMLVGDGWGAYKHILAGGDLNNDTQLDVLGVYDGSRLATTISRAETVSVNCATSPTYPADLIADHRTYYDGATSIVTVPQRGLITRVQAAKSHNGTSPTYVTTGTAAYDAWGRQLWTKDALDRQTSTTYTHDSAGLLASMTVTNPALHATTTAFDVLRGQPLTITDPNGKITTAAYDPLGRTVKVWRPGHPTSGTPDTQYLYSITKTAPSYVQTKTLSANGNQLPAYDIVDGNLRLRQSQTLTEAAKRMITDVQYDNRGLPVKNSIFYNSASGPASTLVAFNDVDIDRQIRTSYDGAARPTSSQLYKDNVLQWQTSTTYQGDRTGTIPPAGDTPIQTITDGRGRIIEKRLYSGTPFTGTYIAATYSYDDAGRLVGVKDTANNQWSYSYDLLGRKTGTVDPDAGTSSATFDDAGQMMSTTDARGQQLFYDYDSLGRKTAERDGSATGPTLAAWSYDTYSAGKLATTTRFVGTDAYTTRITSRDNAYQPLHTELVIPATAANDGLAGTYAYDFTYRTNEAIGSVALPAAGGLPAETLSYSYSNGYLQALTGAWTGGGQTYVADIDYTYDGLVDNERFGAAGSQVQLSNGFGPSTRRLTAASVGLETSPGSFTTKYATAYTYDNAGNLTAAAGTTDGVADQEECFSYDYLRRLTTAWTQISGACATPQRSGADPYWRQWSFDSLGNRLSQVDKDPVGGDTTWTYIVGAAGSVGPHQVKQVNTTGPLAGPTRTFGYDTAGNAITATTTGGVAQALTWDQENHAATIADAGGTTSYVYDADGTRLVGRTPTTTTLYLPDGTELAMPTGGGSITATRYYHAGVAVRTATGLTWTLPNHQGTAVAQISAITLTPARRRMMPYGEPRGTLPTWIGAKGYVGGATDATGLTHLGAREYDPTLGRFISADPIQDLTDPQQWHPYAYSANSPVTFSDPSGLEHDSESGTCSVMAVGCKPYISTEDQADRHTQLIPGKVPANPTRIPAKKKEIHCVGKGGCNTRRVPQKRECQSDFECFVEYFITVEIPTYVLMAVGVRAPGRGGLEPEAPGLAPKFRPAAGKPPLSPAEQATGERLVRSPRYKGGELRQSEHPGHDYVDEYGVTYDAFGQPAAYEHWNPSQFFRSLDRHVRYDKGDYTVLDFTGASEAQRNEIATYIARNYNWPERVKIIIVGDG